MYNDKKFLVNNIIEATGAKIASLTGLLKAVDGNVSAIANAPAGFVLTSTGESTSPEFTPMGNKPYYELITGNDGYPSAYKGIPNSFMKITPIADVYITIPQNMPNTSEQYEFLLVNDTTSNKNFFISLRNVGVFPEMVWITAKSTVLAAGKRVFLRVRKFGNPSSKYDAVIQWDSLLGDVSAGFISISPTLLAFTNSASSQTIQISATGSTSYTISDDQSWISLNKSSSTGNDYVSVSVTANNTGSSRSGTVTITSSLMSVIVTVAQYADGGNGSNDPITGAQICALLHPGDPAGFQACLDAYSIG